MTSKRISADKRAHLPLIPEYTRAFSKDWERLSMPGRYDINRLKEVMLSLIGNNGPLPPEWLDHQLSGDWNMHRDCHMGGDFLLIYRVNVPEKPGKIVFVRAGTHSELYLR
ncbi:MAG: type II toxin-antitoxin system YafQ family toxin [Synergistaceae bacterium]|nr:type II toxin-antitoxin system YafQ family toxin [Synergistaceae bacterium]